MQQTNKQTNNEKAKMRAIGAGRVLRCLSSSVCEYDQARLARLRRGPHGPFLYASSSPAPVTHSLGEFRAAFDSLAAGDRRHDEAVVVRGRVAAKREASRKLVFYTLEGYESAAGERVRLQVMCDLQDAPATVDAEGWREGHAQIARGDVVEIRGYPGASKRGELSVMARQVTIDAPCLHNLPLRDSLSRDWDAKRRRRHVDLLVNSQSIPTYVARSRIISTLRRFVDSLGFLEVETPILSQRSGGATARPFETRSEPPLFLRIAPELYLKRLIVGGIEGVYEIGKQLRGCVVFLCASLDVLFC